MSPPPTSPRVFDGAKDHMLFACDGDWPVFTGSGVASAKQTGHCGLNNCYLTATICSEYTAVPPLSLVLFLLGWIFFVFFLDLLLKNTTFDYFG